MQLLSINIKLKQSTNALFIQICSFKNQSANPYSGNLQSRAIKKEDKYNFYLVEEENRKQEKNCKKL